MLPHSSRQAGERRRLPRRSWSWLPAQCSQRLRPGRSAGGYLAVGGQLAAVICISDPLREEAKEVLSALRTLGITSTVMLTGDSYRTAAAIAAQVGVDDFRAGVLPADKAEYVARLRREGHTVLMVGDGINDSPALSEADAGIAISDGAAIAREIADITIAADRSLGTGRAAPDRHGADGAHPFQLPLRHRLQRAP